MLARSLTPRFPTREFCSCRGLVLRVCRSGGEVENVPREQLKLGSIVLSWLH